MLSLFGIAVVFLLVSCAAHPQDIVVLLSESTEQHPLIVHTSKHEEVKITTSHMSVGTYPTGLQQEKLTESHLEEIFGRTLLQQGPNAELLTTLYYGTGQEKPSEEDITLLERLRQQLAGRSAVHIDISGHTDDSGTPELNDKLAQERAEQVAAWFRQQHWNSPPWITVESHGSHSPKVQVGPGEENPLNRRVEIIVR